jgi:hypothetical protein
VPSVIAHGQIYVTYWACIKGIEHDFSGKCKLCFPSGTMGIFGNILNFFREIISEIFAEYFF